MIEREIITLTDFGSLTGDAMFVPAPLEIGGEMLDRLTSIGKRVGELLLPQFNEATPRVHSGEFAPQLGETALDSIEEVDNGNVSSNPYVLKMARGGNYKAVRMNLQKSGKANAKQPMPPEQKRLRKRKRKSKK